MPTFYGWRMVAAACGIQFLLAALLTQSLGLYISVLSDEMGWSKTTLSGAAALQSVESAIIGPLLGWLMDRFGPQLMIRWGIVIFSTGLLVLSQVNTVATFYTAAILMAIGASLSGYFPLSVALVQWFEKHRARALSIMSLGLALGGLLVPLVAWSMQHWGWRETAGTSGICALIIGLPLARVIRRRPEDHGEYIDGIPPDAVTPGNDADPGQSASSAIQYEFSLSEALRTKAFWLLAIGHGLALLVVTAVNVHAITHMKEGLGYSVATAGWVIMLMTIGQIGGVLIGASIGDRFAKRKVAALCMVSHAVGLLCLTYSTHMAELLAFAVFHGFAWGLRGPFMQAIRADYFGRKAIGKILGVSAAIIAIGQIAGPLVAGILADLTGNYQLGFTVLALLSAMGSVAFVQATSPSIPVHRRKSD
ncbi:MAG: MFS transporter [Betaproteobacteria bacterium]|nr:MFS transporter [Betaproteobacteria bacterium]